MTSRRVPRAILSAGCALFAGIILSATTDTAEAGSYPLFSCSYPGSTNTGQRVWTVAFGSEVGASCPNFTDWDGGGIAPPITVADWRATAPNGPISIEAVELAGSLQAGNGSWEYYVPQANASVCAGTHSGTCSGSPLTPKVTMPAGTKTADIQIRCTTGNGECNGYTATFKPKLVLSEGSAPSASISGGSIVSGGSQTGSRSVTWDAADAESGVARSQVTLGGVTVYDADYTRTSSCSFDTWTPCATTLGSPGPVSIDTTQAPNGTQQLVLNITDAAGNTKTDSRSVDVCNTTCLMPTDKTPAASTPSSSGGGSAGAGAAGTPTLTLNGGLEGRTLLARFAGSRKRLTASYGRTVKVGGRLVSVSGAAVANAQIEVATATQVAGAGFHPTTVLRTDPEGRFSFSTKARSSRIVRFSYRTHLEDFVPAQQEKVDLRVRAPIALRVNRRAARNGRSVRFLGRIGGVPDASRKAVEMQARTRGRWVSFGTARLRHGRFGLTYRFTRTYRRTAYTFRAVVRSAGQWPFETTASKRVRVVVGA